MEINLKYKNIELIYEMCDEMLHNEMPKTMIKNIVFDQINKFIKEEEEKKKIESNIIEKMVNYDKK